ncbi:MAG: nitrate- and nitrite sensing domain-containing protein [Gammaproteobacteria bacterium]|nr:nitrate- and nitrite sensing domain-containing protein [Gammaproteobacteria bacterium]
MSLSVAPVVLLAKQLEIEALRCLQSRARLVGVIGHLIHALQTERGASSVFLASAGKRFEATRLELIGESETVERVLREVFEEELSRSSASNARIVSLIAWILLGLDALPELRNKVSNRHLAGHESVSAFSRLIAGLIALIFEVADSAVAPEVSRSLVSLFNLVEGKELAGQERAVGALAFGAGICDAAVRGRVLHLIDAQERSIRGFLEFAEKPVQTRWQAMENTAFVARLEDLRNTIRAAAPDDALDPGLSDAWFECSSERITYMWSIQREMVLALQKRCAVMIEAAERALSDSEGLLRSLRDSPPERANAIDRFFDPALPVERSLGVGAAAAAVPGQPHSIIEVLQAQSQHLANMESELASAKRALAERKVIERAKGVLMARHDISEDAAYTQLRKVSMDRNVRLVDVAEALLASERA